MALVPQNLETPPFYKVIEWQGATDPWVEEHVIPKLGQSPIPLDAFKRALERYISQFGSVHIVADWPDDVKYFCETMITGPGTRIDTPPITFEILRVDAESFDPHNALADAIGLRDHMVNNT